MDRDELTIKERFGIFLSYLRLVVFLAIAAGVGYWWYSQHAKEQAREKTVVASSSITADSPASAIRAYAATKPSDVWKPVMEVALEPIEQPLDEQSLVPPDVLGGAENVTRTKIQAAGPGMPAWQIGQRLSLEIRAAYAERQTFSENLHSHAATATPAGGAKVSAAQLADEEERRKFFTNSLLNRWKAQLTLRKTRINALYQQMLASEARGH